MGWACSSRVSRSSALRTHRLAQSMVYSLEEMSGHQLLITTSTYASSVAERHGWSQTRSPIEKNSGNRDGIHK